MNFNLLVEQINHVQNALQSQAAHAVNLALTARNWLVGYSSHDVYVSLDVFIKSIHRWVK